MKASSYIQVPQAAGFIEAASEAYRLDKRWNCHIVLHLEQAGINPKYASKHVQKCIHKLGKYHKRHGMDFSYGWVLENAPVKGTHLHLLVHRPDGLPMHPISYRWAILRIFKLPNKKGMLQVRKFWTHQSYERNLYELLNYTLKGLRTGAEERLELQTGFKIKETNIQGTIYGKRISWNR